jgi:hypothetical protein
MSNKNRYNITNDYDDEYDDEYRKPKKKDSYRRRQVKNWKKAWSNNQDRYDEIDEFFTK